MYTVVFAGGRGLKMKKRPLSIKKYQQKESNGAQKRTVNGVPHSPLRAHVCFRSICFLPSDLYLVLDRQSLISYGNLS